MSATVFFGMGKAGATPWTNSGTIISTPDQVGIGTTAPAFKLDVRGGGAFMPYARLNNGGTEWEVGTDATANGFYIYKNAVGATPGSYKLVVNNNGNVGIGTTAPAYKLDVRGGGAFMPYARLNNGGSDWEVGSDGVADGFYIFKNAAGAVPGSYKFVVGNSGYVGVGTTAPKAGLHVSSVGAAVSGQQADRGFLLLGPSAGYQLQMDNDEIQAMNNNTPANLYLNYAGSHTVANITGGNFGIGTRDPAYKLDVRGGGAFMPYARLNNGGSDWEVGSDPTANGFYIYKNGNGAVPGSYKLVVDNNGKVGIGVMAPSELLEVGGTIKAQNLIVTASVRTQSWTVTPPDYVFEEGYRPMSLENVERFTREHKHLPEIPSARQMKSEGIDLADMNLRLLKKVEELMLHAISQEKRLAAQEQRLRTQENRLRSLENGGR